MRIIWDASILTMYSLGKPGFRGGTETMIEQICKRLAEHHTVHVVARDLEVEEQRGSNLWYWPQSYHPTDADVVVMTQQVLPEFNYEAPILILAHTGCDPYLGPDNTWARGVDAWPVFCETHKQMLLEQRPSIPADRVFVTGLGIELGDYVYPHPHVPGRMFYANDPMRGLFYVLDIFDLVKKKIPYATLHVAYDADRQFSVHQWEHSYKAQLSWDMKRRLENTPGVVSLGALSREELIREQLECQVHCMPSDPPNIGTQTWGITQMECAAAGAALVLSDVEAFPEVFAEAAMILPVVGNYIPSINRRITTQDYADRVIQLMKNESVWSDSSKRAKELAARHTWDRCADKWEKMLVSLTEKIPYHLIDKDAYKSLYQPDSCPGLVPLVPPEHPRLQWFIDRIGPTDDVVDLGCSKGEMAGPIARHTTGKVVGVDISTHAIRTAASYWKEPNLTWIEAWAEDTKLPDASFDVVLIGELLEHVQDTDKLLQEAERLLKPCGKVILTVPKNAIGIEQIAEGQVHAHVREYDFSHELAGKNCLEIAEESFDGYTWYMACYQKLEEKILV